jgi:hypothetical protein
MKYVIDKKEIVEARPHPRTGTCVVASNGKHYYASMFIIYDDYNKARADLLRKLQNHNTELLRTLRKNAGIISDLQNHV